MWKLQEVRLLWLHAPPSSCQWSGHVHGNIWFCSESHTKIKLVRIPNSSNPDALGQQKSKNGVSIWDWNIDLVPNWTFRQMRCSAFIRGVRRLTASLCYARLTPALCVQHTDMRWIILLMSQTQKTTEHFYFSKCWIFPLESSSERSPEFWQTNICLSSLR